MSFLSELQNKKQTLKNSETTVTCLDGRKYKESKGIKTFLQSDGCGFIIDTKPDEIPAKVLENLYLGSQDCCQQKILQKYDIHNVLSVGIEPLFKYENVTYQFVECLDLPETKIEQVLQESVPFIRKSLTEKFNILVHCNAGVSRSAAVVIGYLILVEHICYSDAFNLVKNARNCIKPNVGFERDLKTMNSSDFC